MVRPNIRISANGLTWVEEENCLETGVLDLIQAHLFQGVEEAVEDMHCYAGDVRFVRGAADDEVVAEHQRVVAVEGTVDNSED